MKEESNAPAISTGSGTPMTQSSAEKNAKETRLDVLRSLLKKRREREAIMQRTEGLASPEECFGQSSTGDGNVKQEDNGAQEVQSQSPEAKLPATSGTSEMVESHSMSLLDASAQYMFDLMKGLHANQPPAEVKAFDPDRVNSAVNCANTVYKIMRLKLDAIKVQRKIK